MSSPASIRLDKHLRHRVVEIAKRNHVSASEVIRQAIEAWVNREESVTPYDAMKDLIGTVRGGDPRRSAGGGLQVTKLLKSRRSRA